ncbi:MAG: AbrB/MazE/SpoVT family DNA-binding domain-containing protein [Pyrinomonadaceae bacterium]
MTKNLIAIGNSLGIIIEKPILDILNITRDTALEMKTDGHKLIIEPAETPDRTERIRSISRKIIKSHEKTFRKLAE